MITPYWQDNLEQTLRRNLQRNANKTQTILEVCQFKVKKEG